jgi:aspartyl-tRNA(Asn)/glutamyl-tRNA(Gln) amidotransferase subunit B
VEQRDKEDAHEYRYFPDPDLPPLVIDHAWRERVATDLVELPLQRMKRIMQRDDLGPREAGVLVTDRSTSDWTEAVVIAAVALGVPESEAGKAAAQLTLQVALRLVSDSDRPISEASGVPTLGVSPEQAAELVLMRTQGDLSAQGVSEVFEALTTREHRDGQPREVAQAMGLLTVRDESSLEAWCAQVIAGDPATVEQIRAGNDKAVGRLMGAVMQLSGGAADAKAVRQRLLDMITA